MRPGCPRGDEPGTRHDVSAMVLRERPSSGRGRDDDRVADDTDGHAARRLVARRGVIGVLAGALIMLLAAGAFAATGNGLGFLGLAGERVRVGPERPRRLEQRPRDRPVPGAVGPGDLPDLAARRRRRRPPGRLRDVAPVRDRRPGRRGPPRGAPFPADAAWQKLFADRCAPLVARYLGKPLDPSGATRSAHSSRPRRRGAMATARCAAACRRPASPAPSLLDREGRRRRPGRGLPARHLPRALRQGRVRPGVLVREDPRRRGGRTVDLGAKFTAGLPSVDDQDNFLQPACTGRPGPGRRAAARRVQLTVYWTNLSQASSDAARAASAATWGAAADDSGFAPLTGAVKDGVKIGGAAPDAPDPLPAPGAPAVEPSTPAAATTTAPAPDQATAAPPAAPNPPTLLPSLPPLLGGGGGAIRPAAAVDRSASRSSWGRPWTNCRPRSCARWTTSSSSSSRATPRTRGCWGSTRASRSRTAPATTAATFPTTSRSTEALVEIYADEDELRDEVANPMVHEIAHRFGIDDATLPRLGWRGRCASRS